MTRKEVVDIKGNKPMYFCVICRSPLYHVPLAQDFRVCSGVCKEELTKIGLKHVQSAEPEKR